MQCRTSRRCPNTSKVQYEASNKHAQLVPALAALLRHFVKSHEARGQKEKRGTAYTYFVSSAKAKSGATVWDVRCRDMNSSHSVGLAIKRSGSMSTTGYPFIPQPSNPTCEPHSTSEAITTSNAEAAQTNHSYNGRIRFTCAAIPPACPCKDSSCLEFIVLPAQWAFSRVQENTCSYCRRYPCVDAFARYKSLSSYKAQKRGRWPEHHVAACLE